MARRAAGASRLLARRGGSCGAAWAAKDAVQPQLAWGAAGAIRPHTVRGATHAHRIRAARARCPPQQHGQAHHPPPPLFLLLSPAWLTRRGSRPVAGGASGKRLPVQARRTRARRLTHTRARPSTHPPSSLTHALTRTCTHTHTQFHHYTPTSLTPPARPRPAHARTLTFAPYQRFLHPQPLLHPFRAHTHKHINRSRPGPGRLPGS